jgi:hypothetical protein
MTNPESVPFGSGPCPGCVPGAPGNGVIVESEIFWRGGMRWVRNPIFFHNHAPMPWSRKAMEQETKLLDVRGYAELEYMKSLSPEEARLRDESLVDDFADVCTALAAITDDDLEAEKT